MFYNHYGISEDYIRNYAMPDWWDEEIRHSEIGMLHVNSIICRNLGIDYKTGKFLNGEVRADLALVRRLSALINLGLNQFLVESGYALVFLSVDRFPVKPCFENITIDGVKFIVERQFTPGSNSLLLSEMNWDKISPESEFFLERVLS